MRNNFIKLILCLLFTAGMTNLGKAQCLPPDCNANCSFCIDNRSDCDFVYSFGSTSCGLDIISYVVPAHTKQCGLRSSCLCTTASPDHPACCDCASFISVLNDPTHTQMHWNGSGAVWNFPDYKIWNPGIHCLCPNGIKVTEDLTVCNGCIPPNLCPNGAAGFIIECL